MSIFSKVIPRHSHSSIKKKSPNFLLEEPLQIESFFIKRVVWAALLATLLLSLIDLMTRSEIVSINILINISIIFTLLLAILLQYVKKILVSGVIASITILFIILFEFFITGELRYGSLSVILVMALFFALFFNGWLRAMMHFLGYNSVLAICVFYFFVNDETPDHFIVTASIYILMYLIIAYSSSQLKERYLASINMLSIRNEELFNAYAEIELHREELRANNEHLNQHNNNLENTLLKKAQLLSKQNKLLIRHAHAHAHDLRGPLARIIGLLYLYEIDNQTEKSILFKNIKDETHELEAVVNRITKRLNKVV